MPLKKPASVFDKLTMEGYWWIPSENQEPKKLSGTLYFKVDGEFELKILGSFEEFPLGGGKKYAVIVGECADNKKVTLFNCLCGGAGFTLGQEHLATTTIWCVEGWIGNHFFTKKEDVLLKRFSFGINNLEQWHNAKCFESEDIIGRPFTVRYNRIEPTVLYSDDYVDISLVYKRDTVHYESCQTEMRIAHGARIVIAAKNGKIPYYGERNSFSYYSGMTYSFIEILIGNGAFQFDMIGDFQDYTPAPDHDMQYCPELKVELIYRKTISQKQQKKINCWEMLFPYSKIKESITKIFYNFNVLYPQNRSAICEVIWFCNSMSSLNLHTLPRLIYAFEGLQSQILKNNNKKYQVEQKNHVEYERIRKSIIDICNDEQKSFIGQRLNYYPSLKDKFSVTFAYLDGIFPYMNQELQDKVIKFLKNIRDKNAHGKQADIADDSDFHFWMCDWLSLVMLAMIMIKCGMEKTLVKSCLQSEFRQEYNSIKLKIEAHFKK